MKLIPNSYNFTKVIRLIRGLCVQCGKEKVIKFRWCVNCRRGMNFNGR